jgi:hypothetical protein
VEKEKELGQEMEEFYNFSASPLHSEAFWLGVSKTGLPTLVIRTQVHDGIYYNEDPKIFTRSHFPPILFISGIPSYLAYIHAHAVAGSSCICWSRAESGTGSGSQPRCA